MVTARRAPGRDAGALAADEGGDTVDVGAALLHDTIEDCGETVASLVGQGVDPAVALLVQTVSRQSDPATGDTDTYDAFGNRVVASFPDDLTMRLRAIRLKRRDTMRNLATIGALGDAGLDLRRGYETSLAKLQRAEAETLAALG